MKVQEIYSPNETPHRIQLCGEVADLVADQFGLTLEYIKQF
jgi:hypothetical protein